MKNNKTTITIITGILIAVFITACTKKQTDTSNRFYFRHDGADLAVQIDGNIASKTFILLLHGGPGGGSSAYNSGLYSDLLEEKYAVVYMDQRGNGASQGTYSKSELTLAQNSKDVYALTQYLKKKYGSDISLFLMGHSWGGMTGTHALIHTEIQADLKGWIEVDGAHDFTLNDIEAVKLFAKVGAEQVAKGHETEFWTEIVNRMAEIDLNNITDEDSYYLNSNGFTAEGKLEEITPPSTEGSRPFGLLDSPELSLAVKMSNNFGNPILNDDSKKNPLTDRLNEITIPCQFLWGKYDFVVPPELGYSAYNLVKTNKKELVIFEHSGHSPMSNEPDLFVKKVISFIELHK